jgi:hypothetical protein
MEAAAVLLHYLSEYANDRPFVPVLFIFLSFWPWELAPCQVLVLVLLCC